MKEFKPTLIDKADSAFSPEAGMRRRAARRILHEFRYDGASMTSKRSSALQNISPNSFDVQRDRLQLMREAEDMERNFAPAKMLNRKHAMYTAPISYHAQSGDPKLDNEVEEYLNEEVFPNCDVTGRYDFYKMMEFGIMGCNRGGDYGWAFQRPGVEFGIPIDEASKLPLKIQAIEPDRIGGIYQNVVSNDYVSGCIIGEYGNIEAFRVFHRSMTTSVYDNPVDIPASQFVHFTDPMRIDQYRGVSILATAIQNLRDLYEMIDFVKGKAKLASALTVFTNSNGAVAQGGAMDAYATNLFPGGSGGLQQDIQFGQINHLAGGTDIKFPASNSPSSEEQALMQLMLKFVAMSYNLPYSFALDASALGGVSSRLESEMAKAEFERSQRVFAPHAHRIKNAFLIDAIGKGVFPVSTLRHITKGRWGYRSHPQPDIGREASAAVNLWQSGLLNPMKHWVDDAQDPESVAEDMVRWALIKKAAADKHGLDIADVFGNGPAKPITTSESSSASVSNAVSKVVTPEGPDHVSRHQIQPNS
jgi:capsid protein